MIVPLGIVRPSYMSSRVGQCGIPVWLVGFHIDGGDGKGVVIRTETAYGAESVDFFD